MNRHRFLLLLAPLAALQACDRAGNPTTQNMTGPLDDMGGPTAGNMATDVVNETGGMGGSNMMPSVGAPGGNGSMTQEGR